MIRNLKIVYIFIIIFAMFFPIQFFGYSFLNMGVNTLKKDSLEYNLNTSEIITEKDEDFLTGTTDNLTINKDGYLLLSEKNSEII